MDPITHALVGATCAQCFSDKKTYTTASFVGFIAALAPDADVFLGSSSDPLLTLELHRQFTHSLFFIPFGALIIASLLWWFVRNRLSFKATYVLSLAGYATAGLMDYITSYGVLLFWPITGERYAMNLISVFDPLLTLGILFFCLIAFFRKKRFFSYLSLVWLLLYIGFAGIQKSRVNATATSFLSKTDSKLIIKPTIGNQLLWSVRYIDDGEFCSMGVRTSLLTKAEVYQGECTRLLDWETEYQHYQGTVLYDDIHRFSELSNGYLVLHPDHSNVIGDARYSMLPTTTSPLWGITIDTSNTNKHVSFDSFRDTSSETREAFIIMLLGRR